MSWARYRQVLDGAALPAALVDLDALDANLDRLVEEPRRHGKRLRLATKSIRCPELLRYLLERGGGTIQGLMTCSAAETAFLAAEGFDDLLLAYPTVLAVDLELIVGTIARGTKVALVVDCETHVAAAAAAARARGVVIPLVLEVDLAYRPLGDALHLGVWRSPLREVEEVAALARRVEGTEGVLFEGLMAYEAQIAGVTDRSPFSRPMNLPKRAIKHLSRPHVERTRRALARRLRPRLFNGGGSGSLAWCSGEAALTEVTAGSGFLCSHLFDYYQDLQLEPAIFYALQVVRRPATGMVTCHGGGFVASGEAGADRLPLPVLPAGLALVELEGAGEVQTPLRLPPGLELVEGDPVFFRHAKAGELAEHFNSYLLVRGDSVERRAPTYRGMGRCFIG